MNNLFTRATLNNFIYKKSTNIRDILKKSVGIYHKNNKDKNKHDNKHENSDKTNTYIPKIISSNYLQKKQAHKLPKPKPSRLPKPARLPRIPKPTRLPKQVFTTKEPIPKRIRELVWTTNNGETFTHKCFVSWCDNNINVFNFQVGHDIPESKGGTIDIHNLKPICSNCNLSMSNKYSITEWSKLIDMKDMKHVEDKNDKKINDSNDTKSTLFTKIKNILPKLPNITIFG